jgi:hypothetical protein
MTQVTGISNLLQSIDQLSSVINGFSESLDSSPRAAELELRFATYQDILAKQRVLAFSLKEELAIKNWEAVFRLVGLINALSRFLREDAMTVLEPLDGFEIPRLAPVRKSRSMKVSQ